MKPNEDKYKSYLKWGDIEIGDRVKIITPYRDFTFFRIGTEATVIRKDDTGGKMGKYLGIIVEFDNKDTFNFNPGDLEKITKITKPTTEEKMKEEIVTNDGQGNDQIKVIIFPKDMQNDFDMVRLEMTTIGGEKNKIDMTPDEAMVVIGHLSSGLEYYLSKTDKYSKLRNKFNKKEKRNGESK